MSVQLAGNGRRRLALSTLFGEPASDYMSALANSLSGAPANGLLVALFAALGWWLYVPMHELLHAFGCLAAGGDVTRLDIAPQYGAELLSRVLPFVHAGSTYAGQVSGFDTHGSDLIYLATDLAPFLLTVLVGIPLVRRVARRPLASARLNAVLFGVALPMAYAPVLSITGDFYEMASVIVSRVIHTLDASFALEHLRGDDLGKVVERLAADGLSSLEAMGLTSAVAQDIALIVLTFWAGRWVSGWFGTRSLQRATSRESMGTDPSL